MRRWVIVGAYKIYVQLAWHSVECRDDGAVNLMLFDLAAFLLLGVTLRLMV